MIIVIWYGIYDMMIIVIYDVIWYIWYDNCDIWCDMVYMIWYDIYDIWRSDIWWYDIWNDVWCYDMIWYIWYMMIWCMMLRDIWYDIWYIMIWYDVWCYMIYDIYIYIYLLTAIGLTPGGSGDRVVTVVKVLCYKSEGRYFDPTWCH